MVEIFKSPYLFKNRYFCTLCGNEFFGTVEGHFYFTHKNIKKRFLPLYNDNTNIIKNNME